MKPSVGRIVHYRGFGTKNGEYVPECRAAVITEVTANETVGLCILNPTGQFFTRGVDHAEAAETVGDPNCPQASTHGSPFRYCACGWQEASLHSGTWHWPERVD